MTRATKQTPAPAPVELDADTSTSASAPSAGSAFAEAALALAQVTALSLAKGTATTAKGAGALGAFLLSQGYSLGKAALTRAKQVPVAALHGDDTTTAAATAQPRSRRVRRVVVFGTLTAVAAAGVAVWRARRAEPAPVAPAPPSLRDSEAPQLRDTEAPSDAESTKP